MNIVRFGGTAEFLGSVYGPAAPFTVQSYSSALAPDGALLVVNRMILESSANFNVGQNAD